ncbi:MAG TPA: phosphate ABC transporter substrate-binding protein PstS [Jatrophihabitantaceae bacterium]|nr:phosphate ABC transporter substrate-binding protein PstS [Jatrophihabitantaceae bacterium]
MKLQRVGVIAGLLASAIALAACSSSSNDKSGGGSSSTNTTAASGPACSSGKLNAQGSTAQTNAINQWIKDYQSACSGATINYNPTGSGAGVTAFIAKQDDFVGSDSALSKDKGEYDKAQTACGSAPMDLPMVVGPIALAYKLNGVDKLILNGELTAKIFLGKIKTWNDPAIKALNPDANLPSTNISVVYRSDSSGTTQNFEKYLAATAPSVFTSTPDKDSSKAGFAGQGKAKSQGVAAALASTEGSIGYVEYSFAVSGGLSTAQIDNGGGPVELSKDTASKAAEAATVNSSGPGDLSLKIDYATKTAGAYPIILVTYEIVCTKYSDAAKGTFVKNFLGYASDAGQAKLAQLGYAPLPTSLQTQVKASIATIS